MNNKDEKDILNDGGSFGAAHITNTMSHSVQNGSEAARIGSDLLRAKGEKLANVGYEQGKGNLFEYIENAKFMRNYANAGNSSLQSIPVTDAPKSLGGLGEPHSPADFRIVYGNKLHEEVQAKVNNDVHDTAVNLTNGKYTGMQRITYSDSYTDVKEELDKMLAKGEISKSAYNDCILNLRTGLTDDKTGITSGGTSEAEIKQFRDANGKVNSEAVRRYANSFEYKQYGLEIASSSINGAIAGGIMGGIITGTQELFAVYKDEKKLSEAVENLKCAAIKGSVRGGGTGFLSSILRIFGAKHAIPVISDATAATTIAASVIDCGASIYAYAKGEITGSKLQENIGDTALKASATIYFTKAIGLAVGSTGGVFLPIAIYSISSYVLLTTKAIMEQAKLNAQEYNRLAALHDEATAAVKQYRKKLNEEFEKYRADKKSIMDNFIINFDNGLFNTHNYNEAIDSIVKLSNQMHYSIKNRDFNDFCDAMGAQEEFVLR
ncbi:MAG: hypothetical protein EOL98_11890 [Negativicutes bacterium]|nr:hypothetical protein [Negativicutes bacterium]